MFVLSFFICFLCLAFCFASLFTSLGSIDEEIIWLIKAKQSEFNIERCAQLKATYLNLEDAYLFLREKVAPSETGKLFRAKEFYQKLLGGSHNGEVCSSLFLPGLKASPHKEKNPHLNEFWPNWTVRFSS